MGMSATCNMTTPKLAGTGSIGESYSATTCTSSSCTKSSSINPIVIDILKCGATGSYYVGFIEWTLCYLMMSRATSAAFKITQIKITWTYNSSASSNCTSVNFVPLTAHQPSGTATDCCSLLSDIQNGAVGKSVNLPTDSPLIITDITNSLITSLQNQCKNGINWWGIGILFGSTCDSSPTGSEHKCAIANPNLAGTSPGLVITYNY